MEATRYISVLELYPIVLGVHLWATQLKNKQVLFYSDNESIVHVINKQTSKHKGLLALVRQLVLICLSQNIYFRARHVPGRHNVLADSLSRLQVERFLSLSHKRNGFVAYTTPPSFTTRQLENTLARLLAGSLSTSSLKTYQQAWRIFQQFEINVLSRITSHNFRFQQMH